MGDEKFEVLNAIEHALRRPGMYIGSIDSKTQPGFFCNDDNTALEPRELEHVPGLLRLLDEILVNAGDNKMRELEGGRHRPTTTDIHMTIGEDGSICVRNNGPTLPLGPVADHPAYADVPTPVVAFGVPMSGTNFDDTEERTTGGTNGLGAKLTNIYSSHFCAEICDGSGTTATFTWSGNMSQAPRDVKVRTRKGGKRSYTQITFRPDLARFGLEARCRRGSTPWRAAGCWTWRRARSCACTSMTRSCPSRALTTTSARWAPSTCWTTTPSPARSARGAWRCCRARRWRATWTCRGTCRLSTTSGPRAAARTCATSCRSRSPGGGAQRRSARWTCARHTN